MICSVKEAKQKKCKPYGGMCEGDDCMLWKWWRAPMGAEFNYSETIPKHGIPDTLEKKGWCALAGSPK